MHHSPAQPFWWFIYWLLLIGSFSVIGFLLVAKATGYRYNNHVGRWQKTGMLIVETTPKDSILLLDGQRFTLSGSTRIPNVLPGTYRTQVMRNDYNFWEETVTINPGFVVTLAPVMLYLKQPLELPPTPEHEQRLAQAFPDGELRIVEGELWYGTRLVSRFVDPPTVASLLPNGHTIIYLRGKELRVIDTNGRHDQLLYVRESTEPTLLVALDNTTVVFRDGTRAKVLKIQ